MKEQLDLLPPLLAAHLQLTLAALFTGSVAAIPAGVLLRRSRLLEALVLGTAAVIQTIPALALLAVMVPLLSGVGLPGIGYLPAFLGLTLYSVFPVLRNTVTGLAGVDANVIEAARGVGMTDGQRLRRVELPLALPVIIAGLRTAAVWTVGMATLSTPVGAPSLGNLIFSGLQTRNLNAVLLGCVAAAALAIVLDTIVWLAGIAYERRKRAWLAASVLLLASLAGYGFAPLLGPAPAARPIRVGAKTFTEQYILAEIIAARLRAAGAHVEVTASLGSTVAFDALARGEIDTYVDYSGTIWATLMHRRGSGGGRAAVLKEVGEWLAAHHGIRLAAALGFENAYAFAMRRAQAHALGVRTLGDLVAHARGLRAGADYEFWSRSEWAAVRETYGLDFGERRSMDPSLMYSALASGQLDVISAFSSDGRIAANDLVVLADDRNAIPPYDAIVLASARLARERPDLLEVLASLDGLISAEEMRELNRQVDEKGMSPAAVAEEFLRR